MHENFKRIKSLMDWIVKFTFENEVLEDIEIFDVLSKLGGNNVVSR